MRQQTTRIIGGALPECRRVDRGQMRAARAAMLCGGRRHTVRRRGGGRDAARARGSGGSEGAAAGARVIAAGGSGKGRGCAEEELEAAERGALGGME